MFDYFFIQQFYNNVLCGTTRKKILLGEVFVCIHVPKNVEKLLRWVKAKNEKMRKSTSLLNFRPLPSFIPLNDVLLGRKRRERSFNIMRRGSGWINGLTFFRHRKMTDFLPVRDYEKSFSNYSSYAERNQSKD